MLTIGQIQNAIERGGSLACCKCSQPVEAERAQRVTLRLTVEPVVWRSGPPEVTEVTLIPVCPACRDEIIPEAGAVIDL